MSDSYEITGTLKVVFEEQTFGSGFSKREFVITTLDEYPQDLKFELVKEKCASIDKFSVDDHITVHFNVRGNEWKGKYYVNLQAWRLEGGSAGTSGPPVGEEPQQETQGEVEVDDDLIF